MIVSHRHRFVFVKTYKTAGTSIEAYLSPLCGDDDVLTPLLPPVAGHRPRNHALFYNHMRAHAVRDRIGLRDWDRYFKFCVERNPWDKTLSYFHTQKARRGGDWTLAEYLATGDFCVDFPAYTEPGAGGVIVDRVVRYERLDAELAEVFAALGVPFPGRLPIRAKSGDRTDRRPYREVYTPEQAELVGRAFAAEIATFGYEF